MDKFLNIVTKIIIAFMCVSIVFFAIKIIIIALLKASF